MNLLERLRLYITITRSEAIARRYFVVNGFDGALTMLGLTVGFLASGPTWHRASSSAPVWGRPSPWA